MCPLPSYGVGRVAQQVREGERSKCGNNVEIILKFFYISFLHSFFLCDPTIQMLITNVILYRILNINFLLIAIILYLLTYFEHVINRSCKVGYVTLTTKGLQEEKQPMNGITAET